MNIYLKDQIDSILLRRVVNIGKILSRSRLEKQDLDALSNRLNAKTSIPHLSGFGVAQESIAAGSPTELQFRNANRVFEDLFQTSQAVSLINYNQQELLRSEIAALNHELNGLEKSADNLAFLLAGGRSFSYAFLEPFDNNLHQDFTLSTMPDRANQSFSFEEIAVIEAETGVFSINSSKHKPVNYNPTILYSNFQDLNTEINDINNLTIKGNETSWNLEVKSPSLINSTLNQFEGLHQVNEYPGAQMVLELNLNSPAPIDTVTISPAVHSSLELTQVKVFEDSEENALGKSILSEAVKMDRVRAFSFQLQTVTKVQLYIRQPVYRRSVVDVLTSLEDYNELAEELERAALIDNVGGITPKALARIYEVLFADETDIEDTSGLTTPTGNAPESVVAVRGGRYQTFKEGLNSFRVILKRLQESAIIDGANTFLKTTSPQSIINEAFTRIGSAVIPSTNRVGTPIYVTGVEDAVNITPVNAIATSSDVNFNAALDYVYSFGINSIILEAKAKGDKAVFISKPMESDGDIAEIKLKTKHAEVELQDTDHDTELITSVEHSVSSVSNPIEENDWVPIMPNQEEIVQGERFFVNTDNRGFFRFPADVGAEISIYKNGYLLQLEELDNFIFSGNRQSIIGMKLPYGSYTSQDFITCDYTPALDSTVVNFAKAGFAEQPLAFSGDINGRGEKYENTANVLYVTLNREPYINYLEVDDSSYSEEVGLAPYQPVTIQLKDGSNAINLTNYKGNEQVVLDPSSDDIQFVHSANMLTFNRRINEPFTVFYQYLSNNVRFRTVLRSNASSLSTPQVDYVQVKAKTRKADARRG